MKHEVPLLAWRRRNPDDVPSTLTWSGRSLPHLPGDDVLEIGCGTHPSIRFFESFAGRRLAIDTNPEALAVASGASRDVGLVLVAADVTALPLHDNSFDLVLCKALLTTLVWDHTCRAALVEAGRVLRPGGHLLVADFALNHKVPYYADRYAVGRANGLPHGVFVANAGTRQEYTARHFDEPVLRELLLPARNLYVVEYTQHDVVTASGRDSLGFTAVLRNLAVAAR